MVSSAKHRDIRPSSKNGGELIRCSIQGITLLLALSLYIAAVVAGLISKVNSVQGNLVNRLFLNEYLRYVACTNGRRLGYVACFGTGLITLNDIRACVLCFYCGFLLFCSQMCLLTHAQYTSVLDTLVR